MAKEFLEFELKANTTKATDNLKRFEDDIEATAKRLKSKEAFTLSTNVAKIKLEIRELNKQIKEELKKAEDSGDFTASVELDAKTEILRNQLTRAKAELRNFARTGSKDVSVLGKLFKNVSDDINQARVWVLKLWKSTANLDVLENELKDINKQFKSGKISIQQYGAKLNTLQWQANKTSSILWDLKKSFKSIGATILAGLGVREFWRKLKQASDIAISFETAFTGVEKTIDATDQQFKKINKDLKDLTRILPLTFEELSQIAEVGGQLWVKAEDIITFTTTVAKLGATTTVTAEQVATDFAQISNIINEPIANIDRLGASLVDLGNNFATNEGQILDFSKRIAWAGEIVGLSGAEILGLATAFTSVGIEAEAWGTAVQKALLTINDAVNKWGVELEKFATISGVTGEQFKDIWENDASKGFTLFVNGLEKAGDDASQVLADLVGSDVRLARAFLSVANAGDLLNRTLDTSTEAYKTNLALQKEFEKRLDTNASKLKIQENRWRLWGETIGKNVTPSLLTVNDILLTALPTALAWLQNVIVIFSVFFIEKFKQLQIAVNTFVINAQAIFNSFVWVLRNLGVNVSIFTENFGKGFNNINLWVKKALNKALDNIVKFVNKGQKFINNFLGALGLDTKVPKFSLGFRFDTDAGVQVWREYKELNDNFSRIENDRLLESVKGYEESKNREIEINRDALRTTLKNRVKELENLKNIEKQATEERKSELQAEIDEKTGAMQDYLKELEELDDKAGGSNAVRKKALKEEKSKIDETTKAIQKKAEENEKTYESITDDIEDGVDGLEEYIEGIEKVNDKIAELKDDATENIRDINNELNKLDIKTGVDLSERLVEIDKDRLKVLNDIAEATEDNSKFIRLQNKLSTVDKKLNTGVSEEKRKKLTEDRLKILSQIETKFLKTSKLDTEEFNLKQQLLDLDTEANLIKQNTTEEQRKQGKELSSLTKAEETLKKAGADKAILQERKTIFEAIKNGEQINLEEIQDFKNLKLAEDLLAKQIALDFELATLKQNLVNQTQAILEFDREKREFEREYTKFFGLEIEKQKDFAKQLQKELLRVIQLQKQAGIQGVTLWNTATKEQEEKVRGAVDNSRNVDININATNDIDLDLAVEKISEAVK